jgi:hypothetical protein
MAHDAGKKSARPEGAGADGEGVAETLTRALTTLKREYDMLKRSSTPTSKYMSAVRAKMGKSGT